MRGIYFILGVLIGIGVTATVIRFTKKEINLSCPQCKECPPAFEFDKMKNWRGNFTVKNTYQLASDSAFRELMIKDIEELIKKQRLARCK